MKKMFFALLTMLTFSISANAMSYEQARNEALFLTDKMAYELNLTDEQYEAAYEINLDYLMGVTGRDDVFGTYWERRNLDLSYILLDWQWNAFLAATYFYRPLYWEAAFMEDAATITHTPTISASFTESISVCTTAGTEVISAAHATVLPASLAIVAWTTGE